MAAISTKDTLKNLKKKGFVEVQGDHHFLEYVHNGKVILHTKVSHGSKKDLDDFLIKKMSYQCRLDKKEFLDLARCPMSKAEYYERLKQQGFVP
jgi:predicted RNA binding protein YcfA (HicA-like mRNA interferase family)